MTVTVSMGGLNGGRLRARLRRIETDALRRLRERASRRIDVPSDAGETREAALAGRNIPLAGET